MSTYKRYHSKKPRLPEPSTTFPVEFFQASGLVMFKGKYYRFNIDRKFEDGITTTSTLTRGEDKAPVDAASKEYKEVITAIRETFRGTV
jgi:hypothetical protein